MNETITSLIAEARETRDLDYEMAVTIMRELADACEQLQANAAEHQRLMGELNAILHPDGDGPANPSTCDLVAFVRGDKQATRKAALLDAAGDVCQMCNNGESRKTDEWHIYGRRCSAGPIHRRIKEEGL